MCQDNCNDYSLRTANTGIATISTANSNLNGTGTITDVFTAGQLGAIIKSVTIKATGPVTTGMVRLFIKQANPAGYFLYKEVQVPITPELANTPIPAPVLQVFETCLVGDLELEAGCSLGASTQTGDDFNIIVEGLDWDYPSTLPDTCCNFKQVSAVTGRGIVAAANSNLDGSGSIENILTAPSSQTSNGTYLKSLTIKALGSTRIYGMIRLFISANGGSSYSLMREITVPETMQSAYDPSFKQVVPLNFNLVAGGKIAASTQNADGFALTIEAESWSYPI